MKRKLLKIAIAVLAVGLLASCKKDENTKDPVKEEIAVFDEAVSGQTVETTGYGIAW